MGCARFILGRVAGLQGGGEYGQDAHNPDGYYAQGNHNFEQTECLPPTARRAVATTERVKNFHGVAVGSARPVNCDTMRYSTAEGLPLPSFVVATSLPFTYPSKIPRRTFPAGAWTSPFELNLKHFNGAALVSGAKLKATDGVNVAGSARLDKAAVPAARSATPMGKDFQAVSCFTLPGFAASSSNIA